MQMAGDCVTVCTEQWMHKHFTPIQTLAADVNWTCCTYISPVAFSNAGQSDLRNA